MATEKRARKKQHRDEVLAMREAEMRRRRWARSGSLANSSISNGVATGPGDSAFTRTPCRATWMGP